MSGLHNAARAAGLVLAGLVAAGPAGACSCAGWYGYDESALVFVGIAGASTEWSRTANGSTLLARTVRVRFDVERSFKGPGGDTVIVDTSPGDCGYRFVPGTRYLVYAKSFPDLGVQWFTNACSRTRAASGAQAEIEALEARSGG